MADSAPYSADPVDLLPPELFFAIIENLQSSGEDLRNCCLVCRTWSRPSQEILCRHLTLNEYTIPKLYSRDSCVAPHMQKAVQSLTLNITGVRESWLETLRDITETFVSSVANMVNLKSISYHWCNDWSYDGDIETESLAQKLLQNLPNACTSIDLENNNQLYGNTLHICPLIRSLLPRLRHLRFCWPSMCPELFEEDDGSKPPARDAKLETCLINQLDFLGDNACLCRDRESGMGEALQPLLRSISSRVQAGDLSASNDIIVVSRTEDEYGPDCLIRHDYRLGKSMSFPFWSGMAGTGHILRLPEDEGGDHIGDRVVEVIGMVEKTMWRTTTQGVRLPAALMRHCGLDPVMPMIRLVEWEERYAVEYPTLLRERFGSRTAKIEEGGIYEQPEVRYR